MNGIVEETTIVESETITLEQIRQKFVELGAKKVETLEKRKLNIVLSTIELWCTYNDDGSVDNEAILWISPNGKFKVFGLLNPEEFE